MLKHAREVVSATLPAGSPVAVISEGDPELVNLPGVEATHFPQTVDGGPLGRRLACGTSAIAHLEAVRAGGAAFLLIPDPSSRWLVEYPAFSRHLRTHYARHDESDGRAVIYDLREPLAMDDPSVAAQARRVIEDFRDRFDRDPAILDLHTESGLSEIAADCQVFSPPAHVDGRLPYLDASIDIVAVDAEEPAAVAEADRVAHAAVMSISRTGSTARASIRWRPEAGGVRLPSVSIVIPTYNRLQLVRTCVRTLQETLPPHLECEIVIVDDGSIDDSRKGLELLAQGDPRIMLISNPTNAGFIASVNQGARAATREFLVFLNNDTILLPGWLPPLLRTFRDRPDAGAVGGKLVYPDGRLQEAGGVIFSDGSAANFGSGDEDPEAPQYCYLREVDYVSGALLATRRELFLELGCFDSAYGFGYCEDSDYCFKLRKAGFRVYYQPESVIVHVEGGTSGTDVTKGPKRFQVTNRGLFTSRWQEELSLQPIPVDAHPSARGTPEVRLAPSADSNGPAGGH